MREWLVMNHWRSEGVILIAMAPKLRSIRTRPREGSVKRTAVSSALKAAIDARSAAIPASQRAGKRAKVSAFSRQQSTAARRKAQKRTAITSEQLAARQLQGRYLGLI